MSGAARRRVTGAVLLVEVMALAVLGLALPRATSVSPAALVSSHPSDGAVLGAAPPQIVLTFAAAPDPQGSHVAVLGEDGTALAAGVPTVDGATIRQALTTPVTGTVAVAYHVVFRGGGQTSGTVRFSAGTGAAAQLSGVQVEAADMVVHAHGAADPVSVVLLVIDGLVVLCVVALLVLRKPKRPGASPTPGRGVR